MDESPPPTPPSPTGATGTTAPEPAPPAISEEDLEEVRRTGLNPWPVRALQIETSSTCNFRCASCPLSEPWYDRPEKEMDAPTFARILEAFPEVEKIELQGLGEVFLNEGVFDLIGVAVERGIRVHTFSNASKITRRMARLVIESGLELINLSMDGSNEETFRRLRKGGTLKRYKRGVRNLIEARAAAGKTTPQINVMTVLSKANQDQVPQMLAIAEELGVDTIIFTKLTAGPKPDQEPLLLDEQDRHALLSLPAYQGKVGVVWAITPWTHEERMDCYWPKGMAYVTIDGDVTPCCNYWDSSELSLGNVFQKTGAEIWNDQPYRDFRRQLLSGDLPSRCQSC